MVTKWPLLAAPVDTLTSLPDERRGGGTLAPPCRRQAIDAQCKALQLVEVTTDSDRGQFTDGDGIWITVHLATVLIIRWIVVQVCFTSVCGQVQPLDVALSNSV
jgi:hypothetical protein